MDEKIWTFKRLKEFVYGDDKEMMELNKEEEEFDCPIHGKLGGINECPRC